MEVHNVGFLYVGVRKDYTKLHWPSIAVRGKRQSARAGEGHNVGFIRGSPQRLHQIALAVNCHKGGTAVCTGGGGGGGAGRACMSWKHMIVPF